MKLLTAQLVLVSTLLCAPALHAEQIKIPVGAQSAELSNVSRPSRGMSKASVKSQYGQPVKINAAVGKPPISSWEYPNLTVYFEYDHVISSVLTPIYHESTTRVIKETMSDAEVSAELRETVKETPSEMPKEDFDLTEK